MFKKVIAGASTLLITGSLLITPAFAQTETPKTTLGKDISACNMTHKDTVKSIQADLKAKKITKDERKTKLKTAGTDRSSCVKAAKEKFTAAKKTK